MNIYFHDGTGSARQVPEQACGFQNVQGTGEIHCYSLFDGVSAMLMRLEIDSYTEERTRQGALEINFCANGRFETSFSPREDLFLQPGDMAISCYDGVHGARSESRFPLGYYEGICLEVEPEAAKGWIDRRAPEFSMDFPALKRNLLGDRWYMSGQAGPRCEHVFRELYENAAYLDPRFLRLKVLELLMLLRQIPRGEAPYYPSRQVDLVRHLRNHLLSDREGYVSLAKLAQEHQISVSHLQRLFKQVYGMPIYHYLKEYRLEQAAVELVRGSAAITDIAQNAGYDTASKFTEAFKKRYGTTPSQYRANAIALLKRDSQSKME